MRPDTPAAAGRGSLTAEPDRFSDAAWELLLASQEQARRWRHGEMDVEHLMQVLFAERRYAGWIEPLPLDEPPGNIRLSHGFRAGGQGKSKHGPPKANSWVANLPTQIPPAASRRSVTVALDSATRSARIFECAVHGIPATSMMSLSANGTPCMGPTSAPLETT